MDDQLILRALSVLNNDFFKSLEGDVNALATFDTSWCSFGAILTSLGHTLQAETLEMVHSFAETVSIVTSGMMDLHTTSDEMNRNFTSDISKLLSEGMGQMSVNDVETRGKDVKAYNDIGPLPPYIQPSYEWLISNLENPYPSNQTRTAISLQTHSPRKDIDGWFTDARRRIGWNALRKSRFSNKRIDIVDAAVRFFVKNDPKRPLDPAVELEFAAIEARAKDLYAEKFIQSTLAAKLDVVVKDMTQEMKVQAKAEEKLRKRLQRQKKEKRALDALCYPSPERSPAASPEPALPSSPTQGDHLTIDDTPRSSRKRCTPTLDHEHDGVPRKRSRIESPSLTPPRELEVTGLPSPAASLPDVADDSITPSSSPITLPSPPIIIPSSVISTGKRKRRLSDAFGQNVAKRPPNIHLVPRLQAASDPFPMRIPSPSFDEWYQCTFIADSDVPPAVSVDAPDATAQLDIEIYNFSSRAQTISLGSSLSNSSPTDATLPIANNGSIDRDENPFAWFNLDHYRLFNSLPLDEDPSLTTELAAPFNLEQLSTDELIIPHLASPLQDWDNIAFQSSIPTSLFGSRTSPSIAPEAKELELFAA